VRPQPKDTLDDVKRRLDLARLRFVAASSAFLRARSESPHQMRPSGSRWPAEDLSAF
jgi:hypothetical protein